MSSPHSNSVVDSVPFLDISRENGPLAEETDAAIARVCRSGAFVLGPECQRLETSLAQLSGVAHGIGCASGSDALLLSLMAVDVGPGDEVILPSFTFFATASAVWRLGAKIVFADIDPATFNIDPDHVSSLITSATKAIIPVHLFGQPADMMALKAMADRHGLKLIEDAAQAIGAQHAGRPVGSWGDVGCVSFYPTKNLGGFGDGGMMVTHDADLADQLRLIRTHGMRPRYVHREVGVNSRLDSIQAAVLNVKLPHLSDWSAARRANAAQYQRLFAAEKSEEQLTVPTTTDNSVHVWNQFTVRVRGGMRDALRQHLADHGIGSEIYYPIPLHRQTCFASLGYLEGSLPHTEQAAEEVLSLPIFPHLTVQEIETVVQTTARFFASRGRRAA